MSTKRRASPNNSGDYCSLQECNKEGPAAKFGFCDDLRGFMYMYTESAANLKKQRIVADSSEIAPRMLNPCARIGSSQLAT